MYALIGDLVGSRVLPDRAAAQRRVADVLGRVEVAVPGVQPLEATVGDEFQGAWATLGEAVRAQLLARALLRPEVDVRVGIGVGGTEVYDASRRPLLQDGPAWWAARAALDSLDAPRRTALRTWYSGPQQELVNAHLLCRDALLERLNERGWRMLGLALLGESQQRIAEIEGISKSAVSQQFARGIGAVREAQELLEEAT
jgi:hypothetical protein